MINRDHMELWIGALESGDYEKVCAAFRKPLEGGGVGHCAIGVLIDVASRHLGQDLWQRSNQISLAYDWLGMGPSGPFVHFEAEDLPPNPPAFFQEMMQELEKDPRAGVVFLNDVVQESFPEIAQRLRKEYL